MSDPLAGVADLPGVADALDEARGMVGRLLRQRVLLRQGAAVSAESALRGAWASAVLEGAIIEDPEESVPGAGSERAGGGGAEGERAENVREDKRGARGIDPTEGGGLGDGGLGDGGLGSSGLGSSGIGSGGVGDGDRVTGAGARGLTAVRAGAIGDPLVQGALRVSAESGRLVSTWRRAPRQVLARLHALAAADLVPRERLGRPRTDLAVHGSPPGKAAAPEPSPPGTAEPGASPPGTPAPADLPPSPREVGIRLDALSELLVSGTGAPALVVAAIAHGELLALRPFGSADGIVARAAQRLTLVGRGLDPKAVVIPEVGHLELRSAYGEALRAYRSGTPEGVAAWIVHCAAAVTLGAREALAVCTAVGRR
jgi:hypothetical protein